jgi:FkbM family methyltransferase
MTDVLITLTLNRSYQTPFGYQKLPFLYACEQSSLKVVRKIAKVLRKTLMAWFPDAFWGVLSYQRTPHHCVSLRYRAANAQFMFALTKPQWEVEVFSLLLYFVPKGRCFYDIGANWGQHSLFAASLPDFTGDVYAFEPMPTTYQDLRSIVDQADLNHCVHDYPWALGDHESHLPLGVRNKTITGQASFDDPKAKHVTLVEVKVLDNLVNEGVLPPPDLIKLDVEGFEDRVLSGAAETLRIHRPFLIMENWPDLRQAEAVLAPLLRLQSYDYQLFTIRVENEKIFLTPFAAKDRFSVLGNPDIFGCPREKIGAL